MKMRHESNQSNNVIQLESTSYVFPQNITSQLAGVVEWHQVKVLSIQLVLPQGKLQWYLVQTMMVIQNLGAVIGMMTDVKLQGNEYSLLTTVFYMGYLAIQVNTKRRNRTLMKI